MSKSPRGLDLGYGAKEVFDSTRFERQLERPVCQELAPCTPNATVAQPLHTPAAKPEGR